MTSEQQPGRGRGALPGAPAGDDDTPADPRESLALIEETRERARDVLEPRDGPVFYGWGFAWLVAFGVTFLAAEGPAPLAGLPPLLLALLWPVCIGAAATFQSWHWRRHTRGRGGRSMEIDRRITLAYTTAFVLAIALLVMLDVFPPDASGGGPVVVWEISMAFVFALALLYLAQAAYLRDDLLTVAGLWLGGLNAAAALVAPDWYGALMAVLGGGGFLVLGAVSQHRARRRR